MLKVPLNGSVRFSLQVAGESCGQQPSGGDDCQVVEGYGPVRHGPGPTLAGFHDGRGRGLSARPRGWGTSPASLPLALAELDVGDVGTMLPLGDHLSDVHVRKDTACPEALQGQRGGSG